MFAGRIVLGLTALLVAAGGCYDLFTPALPPNLTSLCGGQESSQRLARELLRALGAALAAIGIASILLIQLAGARPVASMPIIVLVLIVPAELVNAIAMRRVGSPFYIPLAFAVLAFLGAALWWWKG